ncbi:MAG TPA: hypothetical protein VFC76_01870 [Oscillospiraceae bacterium]|nr:hypothetical protein [Oscillospiraceae bacterium]
MKQKLLFLTALLLIISVFSGCSSKVVKGGSISNNLTQTKVVLSELPEDVAEFSEFFKIAKPVFYTPGLFEGFIPQGLCYSLEKEIVIISGYYPKGEHPSALAVIDNTTGELIKSVGLIGTNGEAYFGHAGGVACSENTIFITSGGNAYYISLSALNNAENNSDIRFEGSFKLLTAGSFANCENGVLWTGDFVEDKKSEKEKAKHITTLPNGETLYAWCEGYKLIKGMPDEGRKNEEGGFVPDCILSIPLQVQGMTRLTDGRFVFSTSYGRKNNSKILVYEDIFLKEPNETKSIGSFSVPMFCFSNGTLDKEYNAVPMSEGIDNVDGKCFVVFESGANKYRNGGGKYPIDYVLELDIP